MCQYGLAQLVPCLGAVDTIYSPMANGAGFEISGIDLKDSSKENYEIIIIDNCSTDETLSIIRNFNNSRIKIFQNIFFYLKRVD